MSSGTEVNPAFERALQKHLEQWKSDQRSFPDDATPESLHLEVLDYNKQHQKTLGRRYASRLSNMIDRFEGFFSAVDVFVSSNAATAGLVWSGLRFIMRTVSEYSTYFKRVVDVLDNVSQKLHFYHRYATAIYKNSDRVMEALADVYGDILTVFMTIKKTFINSKNQRRGSIMITIQAYRFGAIFKDVTSSFDHRAAILDAEVNHADREADHADREDTIRREKLEHLQRLLRFDESECGEKHRQSHDKILPESYAGSWFLGQAAYREWRDTDPSIESGGLFWLHGPPGSGKTVLTSIVIEDLRKHGHSVPPMAFFYCDYKFELKIQAQSILRSLLEQLLHWFHRSSQVPPVLDQILAELSGARSVTKIPLADIICRLAKECNNVTFVIDALDECQDRKHILLLLRQCHLFAPGIRLFVTSRNEDDIRNNFRLYAEYELQITPGDIENDIRIYATLALCDHVMHYPLFVRDFSLIYTIIETLVRKANGMFLWVFFQLKSIMECNTDSDILDTLENLPKGLEETFSRALDYIDRQPFKERLKRLLRLVVCFRSIRMADLLELIAVDEMGDHWNSEKTINDGRALVSRCGHLVSQQRDLTPSSHSRISPSMTFSLPTHSTAQTEISCNIIATASSMRTWKLHEPLAGAIVFHAARSYGELNLNSSPNGTPIPIFYMVKEVPLPAPLLHVFPRATHVTALNCRLVEVADAYHIFAIKDSPFHSSTSFYSWTSVFPQPLVRLRIVHGNVILARHIVHTYTRHPERKFVYKQNAAGTHVTVTGVTFYWSILRNTWSIYPSVGIIQTPKNWTCLQIEFPQ